MGRGIAIAGLALAIAVLASGLPVAHGGAAAEAAQCAVTGMDATACQNPIRLAQREEPGAAGKKKKKKTPEDAERKIQRKINACKSGCFTRYLNCRRPEDKKNRGQSADICRSYQRLCDSGCVARQN